MRFDSAKIGTGQGSAAMRSSTVTPHFAYRSLARVHKLNAGSYVRKLYINVRFQYPICYLEYSADLAAFTTKMTRKICGRLPRRC